MPNVQDAEVEARIRLLLVGRTGSGKTSQMWTLPGRKFAYIFDPNALRTLSRHDGTKLDLDYAPFLPDVLELDATIKGFNKDARSDKPASAREPTAYLRFVDDINKRVAENFFDDYDWLIFDSLTYIARAIMDRNLFLNKRYGDVEERSDNKVVGMKLADIFSSIVTLPINIYATGHIATYENEKTHRLDTELNLPGRARSIIPLGFTDIWLAYRADDGRYMVRTKPDARGLQDIRATLPVNETEDVTIPRFDATVAGKAGIGRLLAKTAP